MGFRQNAQSFLNGVVRFASAGETKLASSVFATTALHLPSIQPNSNWLVMAPGSEIMCILYFSVVTVTIME